MGNGLIRKLVGIITIVSAVLGGYMYIDVTYARQVALEVLAADYHTFRLESRLYSLQDRLWGLEKQYGPQCRQAPQAVQAECAKLAQEIASIIRRLNRAS